MYLLDTNIVSLLESPRQSDSPNLVAWLRRNGSQLCLSAISLTEIEARILKLRRESKDKRAGELDAFREGRVKRFSGRIPSLDADLALRVARVAERARPATIELADLIVAATADAHGLLVLTRNLRHFAPTDVAASDPTVALPEEF